MISFLTGSFILLWEITVAEHDVYSCFRKRVNSLINFSIFEHEHLKLLTYSQRCSNDGRIINFDF